MKNKKEIEHFIKWLGKWRELPTSNSHALEKDAGVSNGTLHKYVNTEARPRFGTFQRLKAAARRYGYKNNAAVNQRVTRKKAK